MNAQSETPYAPREINVRFDVDQQAIEAWCVAPIECRDDAAIALVRHMLRLNGAVEIDSVEDDGTDIYATVTDAEGTSARVTLEPDTHGRIVCVSLAGIETLSVSGPGNAL